MTYDLLTYRDLEELKARRGKGSGGRRKAESGPTAHANNKRYLILTYISEFDDKVHFPLPLQPSETTREKSETAKKPEQQEGKSQQDQLQKTLKEKKELETRVSTLQRERDTLASQVKAKDREIERLQSEHKKELQRKNKEHESTTAELKRKREIERELREKARPH